MALTLVDERSHRTVATEVEVARDRASRRRGLLGRRALPPAAALVIAPCWMIHTVGMQFPIDVIFVDRRGDVVHLVQTLAPWRLAVSPRAHLVVELAAGTVAQHDVRVGDRLVLTDAGSDRTIPWPSATRALEVRPC